MNNVNLIGRLGRDPEVRFTGSGKAVANFSIAVDDGYGEKKITSWVPVVAWEKTAELVQQYVVKGSQVAVSGQLRQRNWEDRDGNKRTVLEVIARQIDFLTKVEKKQPSSQSEPREFDTPQAVSDEDIPF
jgi:single-strand DNA-binding protein